MCSLIIFHKCICFIDITLYTGILSYSIITIKMFIYIIFAVFNMFVLCVFGWLVVKSQKKMWFPVLSHLVCVMMSHLLATKSYVISFIDGLVRVCVNFTWNGSTPYVFPIALIYHFPTPSRSPGIYTNTHIIHKLFHLY